MNVTIRAFDVGAVADADDVQFPGEAGGDTLDGVGRQRAGQTVQRGMTVAVALDFKDAGVLLAT